MESWLVDVKRVRIPRPKFGSGAGGASGRCYPTEPPKDYLIYEAEMTARELKLREGAAMIKATEDLRRAFQEKL